MSSDRTLAILSRVYEGDDYVLSDTAIRELGMSHWAVLKAMQRGNLPARKIGRQWFIRRADLEAFKESRRRPRTGPGRRPVLPDA